MEGFLCEVSGAYSLTFNAFLQPYLDQRLIRYVARVGGGLDGVEQMLGKAQGNGLGRRFQIGQDDAPGLRPVNMIGAVVGFPERAFLGFRGKIRNG